MGESDSNDYDYSFRVIFAAVDKKTNHFPTDFDRIGDLKIQQLHYEFDPKEPDAGIIDEIQDLSFAKCDDGYIDSIHTDIHDLLVHTIGDEAICLGSGQELSFFGDLESFKRSSLKIELEACKAADCYTGRELTERVLDLSFFIIIST